MRFLYIISLTLIVLTTQSLSIFARDIDSESKDDSIVVSCSKIYFPVREIKIYEDYMGNPEELEHIKLHLAESPHIESITIYSYASPEGNTKYNRWLAAERGKAAKRYILANIPKYRNYPDSLIRLQPIAENWVGMREEIVARYELPDKATVLEIMDREGISDAYRKQLLIALNGGISWRYILKNIMPHLRYATWVSSWYPVEKTSSNMLQPRVSPLDVPALDIIPPQPIKVELPCDTEVVEVVETPEEKVIETDTKTILAVKSNLLYDALSWGNYSVEVPFGGDKFSALVYHQFPWWTWGQSKNEYCIRFLGVGAEARWWFKPEPREATEKRKKRDCLVGHFLGLYGESGKYDFEWQREICYQGEYWSVGLTYGYSMPVSKWLNMEFSLSGGYASIAYRGYTPSPDYSILWRDYSKIGRWHYLGPTKVQISLVVPIIVKVRKKGGEK